MFTENEPGLLKIFQVITLIFCEISHTIVPRKLIFFEEYNSLNGTLKL